MTVGNTYQRLYRLRLLATLPVLLAAVITTGRNYLAALSLTDEPGDWQASLMMSWINPDGGYGFFASRQLVTLFSAPCYCGEFDNDAGVMNIDEKLQCSFVIIHAK